MRVGWPQMEIFASFARYIFRTFTSKATIITLYYVAHQWLFNIVVINVYKRFFYFSIITRFLTFFLIFPSFFILKKNDKLSVRK